MADNWEISEIIFDRTLWTLEQAEIFIVDMLADERMPVITANRIKYIQPPSPDLVESITDEDDYHPVTSTIPLRTYPGVSVMLTMYGMDVAK